MNSPRKAHKGKASLYMLDCRERTGDRGVGNKKHRKQFGGERPVMTGCCCLRGLYTLGGFVGQPWRLARLAKCAIFRKMLVG